MDLDVDVWKVRLFSSVVNLSRTSAGSANNAYAEKPPLLISDPVQLQRQVAQNLTKAIGYVWDQGLAVEATDEAAKIFVDGVVTRVSDQLVAPGDDLRTWKLDEEKYPEGLSPWKLPLWMSTFYTSIAMIIAGDGVDPVCNAAWIERIYDGFLHPLPDGCGRVSKILGAWMLLRGEKYPAHFESRREYYDAMRSEKSMWEKFYRAHVPL